MPINLAYLSLALFPALTVSLFWSSQCFLYASYFILLLFFAAALHLGISYRHAVLEKSRKYAPGIILAALLTVLAAVSGKNMLRVTCDENNLIATSYSLTFEKKADKVLQSAWINGVFTPISRDYDKRPLTYPFLVSLLHSATGARYQNAFAVNWTILFVLLITAYWLSRQYLGVGPSLAMQFLVLAQPVVSQTATSAGMDLTAATFLLLTIAGLKAFLDGPSRPRLQFFWLASLLFFNSRYESPLFAFVLALALAIYASSLPWRGYLFNWLGLTPLFIMPQIWQRIAYSFHPIDDGQNYSFDLSHVASTLKSSWAILTRADYHYPYASELMVLGLAAFAIFSVRHYRSWSSLQKRDKIFATTTATVACGLLFLISTTPGLDMLPGSAAASRLYVFTAIVLSLLAGGLVFKALERLQAEKLMLPLAAAVFLFHNAVNIQNNFANNYPNPRQLDNSLQYLKNKDPRRFLLIAEWATNFAALRYGAVNFDYANAYRSWIKERYESRDFPEILVLQDIDVATGNPTEKTRLNDNVRLEKLHEFPNVPGIYCRISRVAGF